MLRVLLFAPFWASSIDRDDNLLSCFGLLEGIEIGVPADLELPENAGFGRPWTIVSVWNRDENDPLDGHEQLLVIEGPSGHRRGQFWRTPFTFNPDSFNMRIRANAPSFPLQESGEYKLKLFLLKAGDPEEKAKLAAEYPLRITVRRVEAEGVEAPSPKPPQAKRARK